MVKEQTLNWYYFGLGEHYLAPRGVFFVNRKKTSSKTIRQSQNYLRAGEAVAIAQEGTHKNKGRQLGPSRTGAARMAVTLEAEGIACPIVPVGMNTEKMFRNIGRPLFFVIEEALRGRVNVGANMKARKDAAKELDDEVTISLQRAFEKAIDLREGSSRFSHLLK